MNYYTEVVADDTIAASQEDFAELKNLLEFHDDFDDVYHGMEVEYYQGQVHMFCEENGDLEGLPEAVTVHIGKMLTKANLPYWQFGISYTASRKAPGSRGGTFARITPEGSVIFPDTVWPEPS